MNNPFDVSWDLQKAVYVALADDAAVQSQIGDPLRLYDAPPTNARYPFAVIGEARTRDYSGIDGGLEHEIRIAIYSRYAGRREVKEISAAVYDTLHEADLDLPDAALVNIRFVFADALRNADGETYYGALRFRAVTQPLEA